MSGSISANGSAYGPNDAASSGLPTGQATLVQDMNTTSTPMDDMVASTGTSSAFDLPSSPAVSERILDTVMTSLPIPAHSSPVTSSEGEQVKKLRVCADLLSTQLADIAMTITSAPEENLRARHAHKTQDLKMVMSNLKTLSQLGDDSLDSTAYKEYSSIVPKDLQPFQWKGQEHAAGPHFRIFIDIDECLQNFQDTVTGARLDMDTNYGRLVPRLLSSTARVWFNDYMVQVKSIYQRDPSWVEFCVAIKNKYGQNVRQERKNAAIALSSVAMFKNESIEQFIDRFNALRRRAMDQVHADGLLLDYFGQALPNGLFNQLQTAATFLPEEKQHNVDFMMAKAKDLYNKHKPVSSSVSSVSSASSGSGNIASLKRSHDTSDTLASSTRSKYARVTPASSNNKPLSKKFCSFHRVTTHNTDDCRAAQA